MTTSSGTQGIKEKEQKALGLVAKIFAVFKAIANVIFSALRNILALTVFLGKHIVDLLASPTFPAVIAITAFFFVVVLAGMQWASIGVWLFKLVGLGNGFYSASMFGMILGFGINVFQLSPEVWKIQKPLAQAFKSLKIDPDAKLEDKSLDAKLNDWLTYDFGVLKAARNINYAIETGIVLCFTAATGFGFFSIAMAGSMLLLPEQLIKFIGAAASVGSAASSTVNKKLDEQSLNDRDFG